MHITQLQIKNFRCFQSLELSFNTPITLIEGLNGVGKTSLLEALHYLCYLRSFRTHLPQELVRFGQDNFFIKAFLYSDNPNDTYELQVGFSNKKRLVKVNNTALASYKELLQYYRIVTLTEDDIGLIKEGPEARRLFIDQAIILNTADFVTLGKKCRAIVENRNSLLKRGSSPESHHLWGEQLWQVSVEIQQQRIAVLAQLEKVVCDLAQEYFQNEFQIALNYSSKSSLRDTYHAFMTANPTLLHDELRMGRSLYGAHLDDFMIQFKQAKSKNFASRGQQKLIVLLLKAAQIRLLGGQKRPAILLLDDFMTDFDSGKAQILLRLLNQLDIQLIFTMPSSDSFLQKELSHYHTTTIKLTN